MRKPPLAVKLDQLIPGDSVSNDSGELRQFWVGAKDPDREKIVDRHRLILRRSAHGDVDRHVAASGTWIGKSVDRCALPLGNMGPGAPDLRTALRGFRSELRPLFERVVAEKGRVR